MFRHGREVCTFGDSLRSTLFLLWSCAIHYLAFCKRLARELFFCFGDDSHQRDARHSKQRCHVLRGALRAVEETVDDIVLTLAGLSSDPLKERHLTTKSGGRRKLCEDYKKAKYRARRTLL